MPELPEVETVCRGLAPILEGGTISKVLVRERRMRWPIEAAFEAKVEGRRIDRVRRRAKYIVLDLDGAGHVLWHLGMSGRVTIQPGRAGQRTFEKHDHVILETTGRDQIVFNDARRFGSMHLVAPGAFDDHFLIRGLGPEPLSNMFSGPVLAEAFRGRRTSIKQAIMDQRLVVGVGNIYASESLFRAGIHPRRQAGRVSVARLEALVRHIKDVLAEAIAAGGSTLKDHAQVDGELGYFQHRFRVYDRAGEVCPSPECESRLRRIVQSGRATYYCPHCQK